MLIIKYPTYLSFTVLDSIVTLFIAVSEKSPNIRHRHFLNLMKCKIHGYQYKNKHSSYSQTSSSILNHRKNVLSPEPHSNQAIRPLPKNPNPNLKTSLQTLLNNNVPIQRLERSPIPQIRK